MFRPLKSIKWIYLSSDTTSIGRSTYKIWHSAFPGLKVIYSYKNLIIVVCRKRSIGTLIVKVFNFLLKNWIKLCSLLKFFNDIPGARSECWNSSQYFSFVKQLLIKFEIGEYGVRYSCYWSKANTDVSTAIRNVDVSYRINTYYVTYDRRVLEVLFCWYV